MIEIMKRMPALIFDRGMSLPEFSVTANYPSTMNGGKDFCHWSREDRKLAAAIGKLVETFTYGSVRSLRWDSSYLLD